MLMLNIIITLSVTHYIIKKAYPVVITYPSIGAASACLGLLHDNVIVRDVNPVTIGLPGGIGTSENTQNFI